MFLYRILFGNLIVVFLLISIWNFIFIGVIITIGFIIFAILSFRCNYVTYRLSNILITTLQKLLSGVKYIIFKIGEAIIACVSRQSEFKADEFAFLLGYGRYLCLFLEKYDCKINYHPRSIEEIMYSSHPDTYKRISRLKNLIRGLLK